MLNKKLLAAASVAAIVSSSGAFAKTEGNYVGVDLLATTYKTSDRSDKHADTRVGFGVNYKYAFNFDGLFIAPGVFYNANNAKSEHQGWEEKLDNSYGIKADLGYDLTDNFAPFVTFGYQENRLEYAAANGSSNWTSESLIYGVGAKYSVADNIDVSLAYEHVDYNGKGTSSFNPDVLKLGRYLLG
jgi:opacity protein-like surface antigen